MRDPKSGMGALLCSRKIPAVRLSTPERSFMATCRITQTGHSLGAMSVEGVCDGFHDKSHIGP